MVHMRISTAIGLMLSSVSLIFLHKSSGSDKRPLIPVILGIIISLAGLISILFYVFIIQQNKEQFFLHIPFVHFLLAPSTRIPLLTAFLLVLTGSNFLLLSTGRKKDADIAHVLAIPIIIASYLVLAGHILGVQPILDFLDLPVAVNTSVAFFALSIGLFSHRSDTWLMSVYTSNYAGGIMARRLLPGLLLIPLIIAMLRISGEKAGLFSSDVGVVLVAVTYTFLFLAIIWINSKSVNLKDKIGKDSEKEWEETFNLIPDLIAILDENHCIKRANRAMLEKLKIKSEEAVGMHCYECVHDTDRPPARCPHAMLLKDNKQHIAEIHELKLGGDFLVSVTPVFDEKGNFKGAIHVAHDISERKKYEEELLENEARLKRSQQMAHLGSWELDLVKNTLTWSDEVYRIFGLQPQEFGATYEAFIEAVHPNDRQRVNDAYAGSVKAGVDAYEIEHRVVRKHSGEVRFVHEKCTHLKDSSGKILKSLGMVHDITERKKAEENMHKLNRTLKALNKSSQAMLHARDEAAYMDEVCKIIVEDCGYAMIWIGFAEDNEDKKVKPIAYAGFEKGYLDTLNITWDNSERGKGPTGTAIRTGKPYICHNIHNDPNFEPWRDEARRRGYASSAVVPVLADGKAFGAINIYSKEPDSFADDEILLFTELANDLSYGIRTIRLNAAKGRAEEALKLNEERLRLKLDSILSPEVDISEQELSNIIDTQAVQFLMDNLYSVTGMGMAIVDLKGNVLVGTGWQNICTNFHRINEKSLKNCIESDTVLSKGVKHGEFKSYKCKNNLWDTVSPIYIGDKHIGNIFIGQYFYEDEVPDYKYFEEQAEKYGFNKEKYMAAVKSVPRWNRNKISNMMIFYAKFADIISRVSYGNLKLAKAMMDQKRTEHKLQESREKLNLALENGNIGVWEWDLKTNEVIWDERMEKMFGIQPGSFEGTNEAFYRFLNEEDVPHIQKAIKNALEKDIPFETIYRIKSNGSLKYINTKGLVTKDKIGNPIIMAGVCFDITDMKKGAEQALFKLNEDLLRSNRELEQFAYVASHDLQEPLRMVSSFTQLLAQRYQDKLDQDAKEFIQFAVDGATRMQVLINDLLSYSRIQTRGKSFAKVDMHQVMGKAIYNLSIPIQEKSALVTNDNLPTAEVDEGQMVQLFQNLIGNALKFCKESPRIHVSCKEEKNQYVFSVKDNGIGIEKQYFERIFQIFQRLVPKEEYQGTGIGLAICKRIVERHGGRIWLESEPGKGSVFYFTLFKNKKS